MASNRAPTAISDSPDQLARACYYARLLRNSADPRASLREIQTRFGLPNEEAPAIAFARLASLKPGEHAEILSFLKTLARTQIINRSTELAPESERLPPDPEAQRLSTYVDDPASPLVALFTEAPRFMLLQRRMSLFSQDLEVFPAGTRLLLDYPLEAPRLFPVVCDCDYGEVCEAIANAYDQLYASARTNGVTLHDLSDLVVEDILFFPEENVLYPHIGS